MSLSVLHVGYPFAPVGRDTCGGAEQVLSLLDRGLRNAGCRSTVLGGEDSRTEIDSEVRRTAYARQRQRIDAIVNRAHIDVIHLHGVDCHEYLPELTIPALVTLHLPPSRYADEVLQRRPPRLYLNCVSEVETRSPALSQHSVPVIENGIDVEQFEIAEKQEDFVLGLGRICAEKGFHIALDAARDADMSMVLAGAVFPYAGHREYFSSEILPRLDETRRFVGPANFDEKRRLLGRAKCVAIPSQVAETSSLVAMEALAAGTPVIAWDNGALPDLIEDGKTGFVVGSRTEMAQAMRHAGEIDRPLCRAVARERFSASAMVRGYINLYERMLGYAHRHDH